jgi:tRNA pseudouridine38-40 synthase
MMRTFKLTLEYDGTNFHGWQRQPGRRTVQGELERALGRLAGAPTRASGAGRTDAGVHATGQVASARLAWRQAPERLAGALNAILPPDLAVAAAEERADGFDARRDARERRYRYRILRRETRSPLRDRFAWRIARSLDAGAMRRAAAAFRGEHDFSGFCTVRSRRAASPRRRVRVRWTERGPFLCLEVAARTFLERMVRLMAGAVVAAGEGRLTPARLRRALARGAPRPVAPAAPARGLILVEVRYSRAPGGRDRGHACNRRRAGPVSA